MKIQFTTQIFKEGRIYVLTLLSSICHPAVVPKGSSQES